MKQLYTLCLICLFILPGRIAHAQWIDSVVVSPTMLSDCLPINVTAFCTSGCNNATINGSAITFTGNVITMNIDVTQPLICLPALLFFSTSNSITVPSGNYTLQVNYVQNGAIATSVSQSLSVASCCPADPTFTQNISGDICAGDSIAFSASVSNQFSYLWKVNGDTVSNTENVTHTFPTEGTYTVTLIVSDSTCDDSTSVMINTGNYPTIALDSIVDESCAMANNGKIYITPSGGIPPYSYNWQNGYPFQDQLAAPNGSMWIEVSDKYGCASRDTFTVGTGNSINANFFFKDRYVICVDDSLDLTNTSTGASTYLWLENGIQQSVLKDIRVSFDVAGSYDISLVAIDGPCRDTLTEMLTAVAPGNVAANIVQPSCPGNEDGSIDITINGGLAPFSYSWSGGVQTEDLAMLDSGTYLVFIEDSAQCTVRDTFQLNLISKGLQANFDFVRPNDTVYFRDQSDTSAVGWEWDFGDGSMSNEQNPNHVFVETRDYTVCLVATNSVGCQDTSCSTISYTVSNSLVLTESIEVFPNPFNHQLFVSIPQELGESKISVFDLQGRLHVEQTTHRAGQVLDLRDLAKGVYWIRIEGDTWKYSKAIIKQ